MSEPTHTLYGYVIGETDKAFEVQVSSFNDDDVESFGDAHWIPKAQVVRTQRFVVDLPSQSGVWIPCDPSKVDERTRVRMDVTLWIALQKGLTR